MLRIIGMAVVTGLVLSIILGVVTGSIGVQGFIAGGIAIALIAVPTAIAFFVEVKNGRVPQHI